MLIEFNTELVCQLLDVTGRIQADGQDNQVELLFLYPFFSRRVPDSYVPAPGNFLSDRYVASDEAHPGKLLRPLIEPLEILAESPDIVMENGGLQVGVMILGQDHLLLRIGAAHPRTIAVPSRDHLPGTDALNPGDLGGMLPVGRAPYLAVVRTGGGQDPFEVEAGDHVSHRSVAIVASELRVENLIAGRQDDRPYLDFQPFSLLKEVYGVVLANPRTDAAPLVLKVETGIRIYISDQGNCLREVNMNGFTL